MAVARSNVVESNIIGFGPFPFGPATIMTKVEGAYEKGCLICIMLSRDDDLLFSNIISLDAIRGIQLEDARALIHGLTFQLLQVSSGLCYVIKVHLRSDFKSHLLMPKHVIPLWDLDGLSWGEIGE